MAPPTDPTTTTIVTESLKRFLNGGTPSAADISRATSYGMEKVKRDIMLLGKTWRPLLKTSYQITVANKERYDNPSDFERDQSVGLMTGLHSDTLSAVTSASSVTLAVAEDATKIEADGKWLLLTGSTTQAQQIYNYTFATKIALVADAFQTLPVNTDSYLIVNAINDLTPVAEPFFDLVTTTGTAGAPTKYTQKHNATVGQLAVYPRPAGAYGLRRIYYADLMKLDTTEDATTLYTTILRRWADVFEQGVFVWKLVEDDDRYQGEASLYQDMLMALMARDLDGYVPQQAQEKQG